MTVNVQPQPQLPYNNPQPHVNNQPLVQVQGNNINLNQAESVKKANLLLNPSNDEFDNFQTANTQDSKKQHPANVAIFLINTLNLITPTGLQELQRSRDQPDQPERPQQG